jgi:putative Holliday junction resolvase
VDSKARLACDVGTARIGIAVCDRDALLVSPRPAVIAGDDAQPTIAALAKDIGAMEIVVGLPLTLNGTEGVAATSVRQWCAGLGEHTSIPIVLVDERLTTVQAQRQFHEVGRNTRESRPHIDSASAVILLETYLDSRRLS